MSADITGGETAIRARPQSELDAAANADTLRQRADAALTANDTYLAIGAPTNAQNTAQLQRVTRECSAVIRLLLDRLDTIAGT